MYSIIVGVTAFCFLLSHVPIAALPRIMSHSSRHATGTEADEWQWGISLPMHSHHPIRHPEIIQPAAFTTLPISVGPTSTSGTTLNPELISSTTPEAAAFFPNNSEEPSIAPGTEPFETIYPSFLLEAPSQTVDLEMTAQPSFAPDEYYVLSPSLQPSVLFSFNTEELIMDSTNTVFETIEPSASMAPSSEEPSEIPASSMIADPTFDSDEHLSSTVKPSELPSASSAEPSFESGNDEFSTPEPNKSMPALLEEPSELPILSAKADPTAGLDDYISPSSTPEASDFVSVDTAEPTIESENSLFATPDPSASVGSLLEVPSDVPTLFATVDSTYGPLYTSSTPEASGVFSMHTVEPSTGPTNEVFAMIDPSESAASPEPHAEPSISPAIEFYGTIDQNATSEVPLTETSVTPSNAILATITPMPVIQREPLEKLEWYTLATAASNSAETLPSSTRTPAVVRPRKFERDAAVTLSPLPSSSVVPLATFMKSWNVTLSPLPSSTKMISRRLIASSSPTAWPSKSVTPPLHVPTESPMTESSIA